MQQPVYSIDESDSSHNPGSLPRSISNLSQGSGNGRLNVLKGGELTPPITPRSRTSSFGQFSQQSTPSRQRQLSLSQKTANLHEELESQHQPPPPKHPPPQQQQHQHQPPPPQSLPPPLNRPSSVALRQTNSPFFKIALLGSEGVGKTSIIRQLIEGDFNPQYVPTSGLDIVTQSIRVPQEAILAVQKQHQKQGHSSPETVARALTPKQKEINDGGDDGDDGDEDNHNHNNHNNHNPSPAPITTTIHLQVWDGSGRTSMKPILHSIIRDSTACLIVYDVSSRESFNAVPGYLKLIKTHRPDALTLLVANKCDRYQDIARSERRIVSRTKSVIETIPENDDGDGLDNYIDESIDGDDDNGDDGDNGDEINKAPKTTTEIQDIDPQSQDQNEATNNNNNSNSDHDSDDSFSHSDNEPSQSNLPPHFVSLQEGQSFAQQLSLPFIEISSKDGNNIRLLFSQLAAVLPILGNNDDDLQEQEFAEAMEQQKDANLSTLDNSQTSCFDDSYCSIM